MYPLLYFLPDIRMNKGKLVPSLRLQFSRIPIGNMLAIMREELQVNSQPFLFHIIRSVWKHWEESIIKCSVP